ncbi:MAG: NUDIX hydrolase [Actinobacteria bacterium]|jgi:8-oxo-dGTP pyrophosphatase MutT (NUDIX family)|nr:NUDIX hydrolase [Actinomycetota bacterium]
MTTAPSAGGEAKRKKRRRRRPKGPSALNSNNSASTEKSAEEKAAKVAPKKRVYAKRVDEVSAGGLVIDASGTKGLLIGRRDIKDQKRERLLWSLPKGHIEEGETPEQAAIREVQEETGIESEIARALGVIDFWFMAGGKRIHKTVHHYLFKEVGGHLQPQVTEVDDVGWFPLEEIVNLLAYPDEKKLIAKSGELVI